MRNSEEIKVIHHDFLKSEILQNHDISKNEVVKTLVELFKDYKPGSSWTLVPEKGLVSSNNDYSFNFDDIESIIKDKVNKSINTFKEVTLSHSKNSSLVTLSLAINIVVKDETNNEVISSSKYILLYKDDIFEMVKTFHNVDNEAKDNFINFIVDFINTSSYESNTYPMKEYIQVMDEVLFS